MVLRAEFFKSANEQFIAMFENSDFLITRKNYDEFTLKRSSNISLFFGEF